MESKSGVEWGVVEDKGFFKEMNKKKIHQETVQ